MASFAILPSGADHDAIKPFTVSIPEQDVSDMKTLIKLSKVAVPTYENTHSGEDTDHHFGIDRDFILKAKKVWETEYDWRKTEARINSFPNFIAKVTDDDGSPIDVHFVGLFSAKKSDAIPLVMIHGWPGNFMEFLPILSILKSKYTPETLPYHVVIPSLPGFTFSTIPVDKGFTTLAASNAIHRVMVTLGLKNYVSQGGDIGFAVARLLATMHDECKACHVNMIMATPSPDVDMSVLNDLDKVHLSRTEQFRTRGSSYAMSHATVPSTIGLVLSSSPLALLAWVGEKLIRWTDTDPSIDTVLDFVTLYYLTDTIPRNMYSYRESFVPKMKQGDFPPFPDGKRFGYSAFEYEISVPPKPWIEPWLGGEGKLDFYRYHERGGHFAALEKPDQLLADVDEFCGVS